MLPAKFIAAEPEVYDKALDRLDWISFCQLA